MLTINFTKNDFNLKQLDQATPLATLIFENQTLDKYGKLLNRSLDNHLQNNIDAFGFKGKQDDFYVMSLPKPSKLIFCIGGGNELGNDTKSIHAQATQIGATIYHAMKRLEQKKLICCFERDANSLALMAFGARLAAYRFEKYQTTNTQDKTYPTELIFCAENSEATKKLFEAEYLPLAEGVALARDLVNEPPNVLHPKQFADICAKLGNEGLEVDILDEKKLTSLGMGALLGVAQGSQHPARLVSMHWNGNPKQKNPIAIVGKGVTFDTGGISLKPSAGMEEMKFDMGGAATVTGLMKAIAKAKAPINVVGIVALAENMPSGNAIRPSDILTSYSGKTIEVLNTDAEGRLVLADALWYAQEQFGAEIIIDLATLTGAMIVTLGHEMAGLFSNDDTLANQLYEAGQQVNEPLWRLPLDSSYDKMLQSPIADMKNIGGRNAGSITAAQFLQRFIKPNVKWAHLDIAGTAWAHKAKPTIPKGGSGFAVQLLNNYLKNLHNQGK